MTTTVSRVHIKLVGLILSESFQKCKIFAQKLSKHHKHRFHPPVITGFLEMDWVEYLTKLRKDQGGQTWAVQKHVVVFINHKFIGSEEEFFALFKLYVFKTPSPEELKELAKRDYTEYLNRKNLLYTFMELTVSDEYMGSLLFELRPDLLPDSAVRFATLCDPENSQGISYKGCRVRRVCRSGWFQAGEINHENIGYFQDESYCYKHDRRGILSFCNRGKNKNLTEFFVTFKPSQWMDEYYVAFGRVVEGSDVLRRIENTECFYESPVHEIKIINCGLIESGMGKYLPVKLKIKGITLGDLHFDPSNFIDFILHRFYDVLFERLDEHIKREFNTEWIAQMIWDLIQEPLKAREPIEDVLDTNDKQSYLFLPELFLKGMYDLQDIPDHYINALLDKILQDVVEKSDTIQMARSVMSFILRSIKYRESGEIMAEKFINELIKNVNFIIFGSDSDMSTEKDVVSEGGLLEKSISKIRSQSNSRLSGTTKTEVSIKKSVNAKESVVRFVLELLMESLISSTNQTISSQG